MIAASITCSRSAVIQLPPLQLSFRITPRVGDIIDFLHGGKSHKALIDYIIHEFDAEGVQSGLKMEIVPQT
jgi:hypothetical protein